MPPSGGLQREVPALPPILRTRRVGPMPLSFAQERLWFMHQLMPNTSSYNIGSAIRLHGPLDVHALKLSWDYIVGRHEILRTSLLQIDGQPRQAVGDLMSVSLTVTDVSNLNETASESESRRLATEEIARPFDLSVAPLFRSRLLRLSEEDHILVCCVHHIVFDGWSFSILMSELSSSYQAFREGETPSLSRLPIQYADFAAWQRTEQFKEVLETQLEFWRHELADAPAVTDLPTDRPRSANTTDRGNRCHVRVSPYTVSSLAALARRERASMFMVFLAAFAELLRRYAGQDDVVIGTPISNRSRIETEQLIGLFINTLALRVDISGNPSFRDLLGRVRGTSLAAYAHQDLPFQTLVENLQPARDMSRHPIFQVMFTLAEASQAPEFAGLRTEWFDLPGVEPQFDLSLTLVDERLHGVLASIEYRTGLFNEETVMRMLGHLRVLLGAVASDPDRPLSELSILSKEEWTMLVDGWARGETRHLPDAFVHELFEEQAARTPDALAVEFNATRLTYHQLSGLSDRLSCYLQRTLGVEPGTLVALCLDRSPDVLVAMLGVLKAGAAFLPLDPTHPLTRLSDIIDDARSRVVLTHGRYAPGLQSTAAQVVCIDNDWAQVTQGFTDAVRLEGSRQHLAYVIYTSGSTGRPKGVEVTHHSLVNYLLAAGELYELTSSDRVLQFASPAFDWSIDELLSPLLHGACVLIPSEASLLSPRVLLEQCEASGVSIVMVPPALLEQLALVIAEDGRSPDGVRLVVTGGDRVSWDLVRSWQSRWDGEFLSGYGPTEATISSTFQNLRRSGTIDVGEFSAPLGRPIANTQVYVLDSTMQPTPIGVPGEIYIGGIGVAHGYLHRPDLTALSFVPDPFGSQPGARLYKTGDSGRYLSTGEIEFRGRLDQQVKLRGYRIETAEIEAKLTDHSEVRQAAVVKREDAGEQQLVAYIVTTNPMDIPQLRAHLRRSLPDYMMPTQFVRLDTLPLNSNGKLDLKALPVPERRPRSEQYQPPRTADETYLASLWGRLLRIEDVGVEDNFFELGGHSLLAMAMLGQIRSDLGIEIQVRSLFETPVLGDFAAGLEFSQ
jgi:amino acid adenylation domain-containing protein